MDVKNNIILSKNNIIFTKYLILSIIFFVFIKKILFLPSLLRIEVVT